MTDLLLLRWLGGGDGDDAFAREIERSVNGLAEE
jgi:hypothetical protein